MQEAIFVQLYEICEAHQQQQQQKEEASSVFVCSYDIGKWLYMPVPVYSLYASNVQYVSIVTVYRRDGFTEAITTLPIAFRLSMVENRRFRVPYAVSIQSYSYSRTFDPPQ